MSCLHRKIEVHILEQFVMQVGLVSLIEPIEL